MTKKNIIVEVSYQMVISAEDVQDALQIASKTDFPFYRKDSLRFPSAFVELDSSDIKSNLKGE
jgi:hypothetical protein